MFDQKKNNRNYESIDFGTPKPTSVKMETVEVTINPGNIVSDYAKAFVREAYRRNYLKAEQVKLRTDELIIYSEFLLKQRVDMVNQECKIEKKLKLLAIPGFVQFALSTIGIVVDRQRGLKFVPKYDWVAPSLTDADNKVKRTLSFQDILEISEKIAAFEDDLTVVFDAMPRGIDGNVDVMSTALIDGYVRAVKVVEHPVSTYISAYLGLALKREMDFSMLYRVQYDDLEFIASGMANCRALWK